MWRRYVTTGALLLLAFSWTTSALPGDDDKGHPRMGGKYYAELERRADVLPTPVGVPSPTTPPVVSKKVLGGTPLPPTQGRPQPSLSVVLSSPGAGQPPSGAFLPATGTPQPSPPPIFSPGPGLSQLPQVQPTPNPTPVQGQPTPSPPVFPTPPVESPPAGSPQPPVPTPGNIAPHSPGGSSSGLSPGPTPKVFVQTTMPAGLSPGGGGPSPTPPVQEQPGYQKPRSKSSSRPPRRSPSPKPKPPPPRSTLSGPSPPPGVSPSISPTPLITHPPLNPPPGPPSPSPTIVPTPPASPENSLLSPGPSPVLPPLDVVPTPQPSPVQKRQVNVLIKEKPPTTTTSISTLNTKPTPKREKPGEEEPIYEMAEDYNDESSPVGTRLDEEAADGIDSVSDPLPQSEHPGYYPPPIYPPPQMWPPPQVWPDQSVPFGNAGTFLPDMYQSPPLGYEPPSVVINQENSIPPAESGQFMRYETSNIDDENSVKVDTPSPVDKRHDGPRNNRRDLGYVEPPPQFTGARTPKGGLHEYAGGDDNPGVVMPSPSPVLFQGHEYVQGENDPVALPTPTPTPTPPPVYYSTGGAPPVLGHEYAGGDNYPGTVTPSSQSPPPVLFQGHEYVQGGNDPVALPTPTPTPTPPPVYYYTGGPPPVLGHEYAGGDNYPGAVTPSLPSPPPVLFQGHEYVQGENDPVALPTTPTATPTPTPTPTPVNIPKSESVEDTDDNSIPTQSEYIGYDGRHPLGDRKRRRHLTRRSREDYFEQSEGIPYYRKLPIPKGVSRRAMRFRA